MNECSTVLSRLDYQQKLKKYVRALDSLPKAGSLGRYRDLLSTLDMLTQLAERDKLD